MNKIPFVPAVRTLSKKAVLLSFLVVLNFCFSGCGNDKKKSFATAIAELKKNANPDKGSVKIKRFLEAPPTFIQMTEKKRLFLLLVEYDESSRKLFLGRLRNIPKEVVDSWGHALSEKSGEDIDEDIAFHCLPNINSFFSDSLYNKSVETKYLSRLKSIPANIVNDWKSALTSFDDDDNRPTSNTLLIMINLDLLFTGSGLNTEVAQKILTRLKHLETKSITKLASLLKYDNLKLFAANIASEAAFFEDNDVFKESMVEQSLTASK